MVAAKPPRTVLAVIAGILLLLGGLLGILVGVALMVGGGVFVATFRDYLGTVPELGDGATVGGIVGGMILFFGVIILAYSLAYVIGGIGVLRSRDWGRVIGVVISLISGLIWLSGVTGSSSLETGAAESQLAALVGLGIHVYILVTLLFFWRTRAAT